MRVLIVEDTPAEADLFADLVAHRGHDPIVAASAEAALESLAAAAPDAVLLDLILPGMSGLDFLRVLTERHHQCPVVAISGVATEEQARESLALGAMEFLPKPLTIDQLELLLDCLEVQLLTRRFLEEIRTVNRRRYARVKVTLDVAMEDPTGRQVEGQTVDLSPFGVKVRAPGDPQPGNTAKLSFSAPDGDGHINVLSLLVRKDTEGLGFAFINLTNADFNRLKGFVDSRLPRPS